MIIKIYKKLRAYNILTFGKTKKIVINIANDADKWGEFKMWITLIFGSIGFLILFISENDIHGGIQIVAILATLGFLGSLLSRLRRSTFFISTLFLGPISLIIITIKQIYKCLKKLFIRSAGA